MSFSFNYFAYYANSSLTLDENRELLYSFIDYKKETDREDYEDENILLDKLDLCELDEISKDEIYQKVVLFYTSKRLRDLVKYADLSARAAIHLASPQGGYDLPIINWRKINAIRDAKLALVYAKYAAQLVRCLYPEERHESMDIEEKIRYAYTIKVENIFIQWQEKYISYLPVTQERESQIFYECISYINDNDGDDTNLFQVGRTLNVERDRISEGREIRELFKNICHRYIPKYAQNMENKERYG